MTNYQKWNIYCRHLGSPQAFIDFGWYGMIGAALQRRVWVGPAYSPLFPNPYIIFCGEPGIGKGMVIKQVRSFLGHHKLYSSKEQETQRKEQERALKSQQGANKRVSNLFSKESNTNEFNKKLHDDPLLFKMGSESYGSYQALVKGMADSYTGCPITKDDGSIGTYLHSSLALVLEEVASLFRKHTEDLANFLLQAYDCGDYVYELISREKDRIKSCCLSIMAGTTPSFMQETFDDRLLNEGFSSRCWYICATENRSNEIFLPELDHEQKICRLELLQHLRDLKDLYGQSSYTPDAAAYLCDWWRAFPNAPKPNPNPKLKAYYSRKNIHIQKLAIAIHYSENIKDRIITLAEVKKAHDMLDNTEKNMHLALNFKGTNPLVAASRIVESQLKVYKTATKQEVMLWTWDYIRQGDLTELLESMTAMGKIKMIEGKISLR